MASKCPSYLLQMNTPRLLHKVKLDVDLVKFYELSFSCNGYVEGVANFQIVLWICGAFVDNFNSKCTKCLMHMHNWRCKQGCLSQTNRGLPYYLCSMCDKHSSLKKNLCSKLRSQVIFVKKITNSWENLCNCSRYIHLYFWILDLAM